MLQRKHHLRGGVTGCLFKVVLSAMNEPKSKSPGSAQGGGASIYLVDDQPMLLELATVILEPQGYSVEAFTSPEAALRAFENAEPKPALIVTDYAMETMTGLELAEACRRLRPEQRVILISGTVGTEILHNVPVEPDRFLGKPYQPNELVEAVRSVLAA